MSAATPESHTTIRQDAVMRLLVCSYPSLQKLVAKGYLSEIRLPFGKPRYFLHEVEALAASAIRPAPHATKQNLLALAKDGTPPKRRRSTTPRRAKQPIEA